MLKLLTFEQLPNEIHLNIFDYISKQSLNICALVSKFFFDIATHRIERKNKLEELFSKRMIEVLGGYDKFLKIPIVTFANICAPSLSYGGAIRLRDITAPIMKGVYQGKPFITFLAEEVDAKICYIFCMHKTTSWSGDTIWDEGGSPFCCSIFDQLSLNVNLSEQQQKQWDIARNFFLGKDVMPRIGEGKFVIYNQMPKAFFKDEYPMKIDEYLFVSQVELQRLDYEFSTE